MQPIPLIVTSLALEFLGGVLTFLAWGIEVPELYIAGGAVGVIGTLVLFVGLTSLAVEVGIRSARR